MSEKTLNPNCPCPKIACERNKDCEACQASHKSRGNLPACQRPKKVEEES